MNIKNLFLIMILIATAHLYPKGAAKKKPAPTQSATPAVVITPAQQAQILKDQQNQAAAIIFGQNLPTQSIHEQTIDQIYGSAGLHISNQDLVRIKNSYCYLEFLAKLDKVQHDPKYSQYQTTDFKDFIQPSLTSSALMPTQALVQSPGWKAIEVSSQDLIASAAWQNFIKAMICDSFDNDANFVIDTTQTSHQIFSYIPNIETSYQTNDFTSLRLYQESIQLQALLQAKQRNVYFKQTLDWQISSSKMVQALTEFKKKDFYTLTHNAQATKPAKDPKTSAAQQPVIASPLREQIVCYFMFMYIQTTVNDLLTVDNAAQFVVQANAAQLSPNFFMYNQTDYILLCDMFNLQKTTDDHVKNPKKTEVPMVVLTAQAAPPAQQTPANTTPQQNVPTPVKTPEEVHKETADIIFQKLQAVCKYEKTIDTIYGPSGLHIAAEQILRIKKAYCYLEFLVKLDKVQHDKKYQQYQKTDFKDFIQSKPGDNALFPTEVLVKSTGWNAIEYSNQDMLISPAWQMFIKAMICDIYDSHDEFIIDSYTLNDQMVDDIANIEGFYSSNEFTQIRLANENMQLSQVMLQNQQKVYLAQCSDWQKLNQKELIAAITEFKKTDFYDLSHNGTNKKTQEQGKKQYSSIASPTKEQLISYYSLISIQTDLYNLLTLENLASFLTTANSPELSPNFFAYQSSDYVYLYDHLTLSDMIDENDNNLHNIQDDTENEDEVVIQSARNDLKKMNKASARNINKMNKASARNIKKMNQGTKNSLRKMNKATARNVKKMNHIIKKRWQANKKLILAVVLTVVIVVAVAALIVCTGGTASPIVGAMMAPVNAAIWAGGAAASAAVSAGTAAAATASSIIAGEITATTIAASIAASSAAAFTAATTTVSGALIATAVAGTVAVSIAAMADTKFRNDLMKNVLMPMMQGMEVMTDACTTGFIELSVGLTYACSWIGQNLGYPVNPKIESAKVKAKMEKYRGTINMIMSVVVTIIITVVVMACTAGLGAAYASAVEAGWFGTQAAAAAAEASLISAAAASSAAEAALTTAVETGATQAQILAARQTAQLTAQSLTKASAQKAVAQAGLSVAEKQGAEASAQLALKQAVEKGADKAIQQGLTDAITKATAERQAAQLVAKQAAEKAAQASTQLTTLQASQKTEQAILSLQTKPPTRIEQATNYLKSSLTKSQQTPMLQTAENPMLEGKIVAQGQVETAANSTKTASQKAAEKQAAKLGEKMKIKQSKQAAMSEEKAAKAAADEAKRLPGQSAEQKIADQTAQDLIKKEAVKLEETMAQAATKQRAAAVEFAEKKAGQDQLTWAQKAMGKTGRPVSVTDKQIAEAMVQQQATSIENLTISQQARQFGLKAALKDNMMTWSFAFGQLINGIFGIFGAMAAANQDEMAAEQADQEKKSIASLWAFVEDTKTNITQSQTLFLDELHKKHQVAVENQAFGLQYYENFLHGSVNGLQDQISQALAEQQISLLQANANGLRPADIGSTWGLQTPFTYTYPSQGFISTTLGRPDFPYAQEVAQAPLASQQQKAAPVDLSDNQSAATKLWFNQRAMAQLNQKADAPVDIEISFRIIYTLPTAYHVGLYLGGNYHDYASDAYLKEIQEKDRIDMNEAHLAKMFVLKRDTKNSAPSIGLYEHEGKGWITEHPLENSSIDTASIYHMNARWDKNQMTIRFWSEKNPALEWSQSITVNPCDQRPFGIIFSGVAVEWNVIKPTLKIIENKKARAASNGQSEIAREKSSKALWKKLTQPQFGFMKLQAISKLALLQGKYLYTTQDTGLLDQNNDPFTDYVLYGSYDNTTQQLSSIGQTPQPQDTSLKAPNVIVSLITGNVYNASKKIVLQSNQVLELYTHNNKLSPTDIDTLTSAINAYKQIKQAPQPSLAVQPTETIVASQTVSMADLLNATPPMTGGMQIGLTSVAPSQIVATSASISQLQRSAAQGIDKEQSINTTQRPDATVIHSSLDQPVEQNIAADNNQFNLVSTPGLAF